MKKRKLKTNALVLVVQFSSILLIGLVFLIFKFVGNAQKEVSPINRYTIEVHYDPAAYTAIYTLDSHSNNLSEVLEELKQSEVFSYTAGNGVVREVNGIFAEEEKSAKWIAKVNWDQEYTSIEDVPALEHNSNIWLLYTQEVW